MYGSVIVIGAGPGVGAAAARRFAAARFGVALIARRQSTLDAVAASIRCFDTPVVTITADSSNEVSLRDGLDRATAQLGTPDVVIYNAAVIRPDRARELTMSEILETWAVNVGGAVIAAGHLLPKMARQGGGTLIITGGMPEARPGYATLSLGKAGVRALVSLLDAEFGPAGVHVASVTISGAVVPGTKYDPDLISEHYWHLHIQPAGSWQHEITH